MKVKARRLRSVSVGSREGMVISYQLQVCKRLPLEVIRDSKGRVQRLCREETFHLFFFFLLDRFSDVQHKAAVSGILGTTFGYYTKWRLQVLTAFIILSFFFFFYDTSHTG